jgi:hypothetical protein
MSDIEVSSLAASIDKRAEARAVRKVDFLVLPCIVLMFLHLQFVSDHIVYYNGP